MIPVKTKEQIKIMREGGKKLARVMEELKKRAVVGARLLDLNTLAEKLIKKAGGQPSFKMVPKYGFSTCLCVNECVVHGVPTDYRLKEGDILGIDVGIYYRGFHTDMARTLRVRTQNSRQRRGSLASLRSGPPAAKLKTQNDEIENFLEIGELALDRAIKTAIVGNHVGDISRAIQETIEGEGYSVVKQLVGHGIGKKLHEDPQIPGFVGGKITNTSVLREGMTLAIEVIYNLGSDKIIYKNEDGWTIVTRDRSLSGLLEHTIAITKEGPIILTKC